MVLLGFLMFQSSELVYCNLHFFLKQPKIPKHIFQKRYFTCFWMHCSLLSFPNETFEFNFQFFKLKLTKKT
jgi:hypothetical protein